MAHVISCLALYGRPFLPGSAWVLSLPRRCTKPEFTVTVRGDGYRMPQYPHDVSAMPRPYSSGKSAFVSVRLVKAMGLGALVMQSLARHQGDVVRSTVGTPPAEQVPSYPCAATWESTGHTAV
jgi:hypothetical protein